MISILAAAAVAASSPYSALLDAAGFKGSALVARGDRIEWQTPKSSRQVWPWASVTKQVVATLVMQEVEKGRIVLDSPLNRYVSVPEAAAMPTVRQLLQHQSGLRDPSSTPVGAGSLPAFYSTERQPLSWCLTGRSAPASEGWTYNNCDYIVLGEVLRKTTGLSPERLVAQRIAQPLKLKGTRLLTRGSKPVGLADGDARLLAGFGAAAAIAGTMSDLFRFDRALITDRLLSSKARAEMWAGNPKLGFMGLGQWSFSAPIKGCAQPVKIIERRGAVGTTQVRNLILPDQDITVILFTADGDFDFGEIWQGKGASHDLISAAACAVT